MKQQAAAAGLTRRTILLASSALSLAGASAALAKPAFVAAGGGRVLVEPVPARHVSLKPSIFARAQDANRAYLVSLQPDRLLHNFHLGAGLPVKAPVYGGWEAQSIAGHTLGHYLSACALQVANDGDPVLSERLAYTVAQLARVQAAHGDGYVGGTTPAGARPIRSAARRCSRNCGAATSAPIASASMTAGCRSTLGTRSMPACWTPTGWRRRPARWTSPWAWPAIWRPF